MLGRPAVAVVADHDKAEIFVTGNPRRFNAKEAVVGNVLVMFLERTDHVLAPGVGTRLGPAVPDSGGPGFGVEKVIVASPQRVDGDQDRSDRQAGAQAPGERITRRAANPAQAAGKPQPAFEPALGQPAHKTGSASLVYSGEGAHPATPSQRTRQR